MKLNHFRCREVGDSSRGSNLSSWPLNTAYKTYANLPQVDEYVCIYLLAWISPSPSLQHLHPELEVPNRVLDPRIGLDGVPVAVIRAVAVGVLAGYSRDDQEKGKKL